MIPTIRDGGTENVKFSDLSEEDKLRLAFRRDIFAICKDVGRRVNIEFTEKAMLLIDETVWRKLRVYATDLECFAKHAKRTTVNTEDVKLLFRRNPSLKEHILQIINANGTKKKRGPSAFGSIEMAGPSKISRTSDGIQKNASTTVKGNDVHDDIDNTIDLT